ncbi:hypothetical protein N0P44_005565, partial [Citrobacter freundii]|nr:hypothetical protein [Salmonella enterica]EKW0745476.1 hypothetical protein [Citrobacter freundii]
MSEIFFIVWGVIGIFIIGIGFICLYEFIKSRYEDKKAYEGKIDGLQSLVFKLEHKLDCVVYECKKRGFDLEDDLDYDDDD